MRRHIEGPHPNALEAASEHAGYRFAPLGHELPELGNAGFIALGFVADIEAEHLAGPMEQFRLVVDVNLIAPVYWALEMIGRIAEQRAASAKKRWVPDEGIQGSVVFIGSISSQGNRGQISYASTKAGLEGAAATIMKEAMYYGVRCSVIHPGFTDTPMVRAMGDDYVAKNILPFTQLGRLIRPDEIADAICFMLANAAVSGELWVDAGWHAPA